jgi:hypothetical protein
MDQHVQDSTLPELSTRKAMNDLNRSLKVDHVVSDVQGWDF